MFFSKSMTFDEEKITDVAQRASGLKSARKTDAAQEEFLERLKTEDAAAFDLLVTKYSADVYAVLFRLTENAEEAADLTQETFLHALRAIKNFRGEANLKTWLLRIAVNQSRNRFRWWKRRNREKTISLDAPAASDNETALSETIASRAANPEEEILRRERHRALRTALQNLPEVFREAVVFCDIEGLSYEEIAATLQISVGTVKSRIARGREELRRKLSDI
jgi:RNA polymerase sigma-70 factor (ECF subfamily)